MLRFILYLILVYLLFLLVRRLFASYLEKRRRSPTVLGTSESKGPKRKTEIDEGDIEDAKFEEIEE